VKDPLQFTAEEERAIREAARRGQKPACPRCEATMTPREIGGGSFGLGYARRREWLICPRCHRSVLFDRKWVTRNCG
jgi:transposase-like protein